MTEEKGSWSILKDGYSILGIRKIRLYMIGQSVNLVGDWMQQTAQAWLVWELTRKATALGLVAFLSQIPFFVFGPWAGSVSERFDKRKILLATQLLAMLFAFVLAFLVQTNLIVLWHVYLLSLLLGIVTAFNTTAEQAFIGEIAGAGNVKKALALNNSINQLSRFIGPAIAGWLIASVGIAASFWLNGLSILASVICIWIIPGSSEVFKSDDGEVKRFVQGLTFLRHHQLLRLIILFAAVQTFFGLSIIQLLPAIATLVLKGDAHTLGFLTGAAGSGAFIGTAFVLPYIQRIKRSCIAIGAAVIWSGIWYTMFSFSRNLPLSLLCQFMASLGAANVLTLSAGLVQELTPIKMRARIISTFLMIVLGLQPFASYLIGKIADLIGVNTTMLISGGVMICLPAFLLTIPALNKLKQAAEPIVVKHPIVG